MTLGGHRSSGTRAGLLALKALRSMRSGVVASVHSQVALLLLEVAPECDGNPRNATDVARKCGSAAEAARKYGDTPEAARKYGDITDFASLTGEIGLCPRISGSSPRASASPQTVLVGWVPSPLPLHPWSISTALEPRTLVEGTPVIASAGAIFAGPVSIDLTSVKAEPLLLEARLRSVPSGLGRWLLRQLPARTGTPVLDDPIHEELALFAREPDVTRLAGRVGQGSGLTPLADDVLIGMLAALDLLSFVDARARGWRRHLDELLAGDLTLRTSRLSAQLLAAALLGHFAEPILELAASLVAGQPPPASLTRLLAMGETSGGATLAGFAAILAALDRKG